LCCSLWKLNDEDFSISDYIALNAELEGTWKVATMAYDVCPKSNENDFKKID